MKAKTLLAKVEHSHGTLLIANNEPLEFYRAFVAHYFVHCNVNLRLKALSNGIGKLC